MDNESKQTGYGKGIKYTKLKQKVIATKAVNEYDTLHVHVLLSKVQSDNILICLCSL